MKRATATAQAGFYITGGSLRRDAPCYVERSADGELCEGLRQGKFCYVLTARQMGKSSLMVRTAARLREEGVGVAVLDLTAIGQNLTAEQWYGGLLIQMGQQLELEDDLERCWRAGARLGPLQRWAQALRQVVLPRYPDRMVVFIDEIDAVRSLPFSTDELFAAIREFYNSRTQDVELDRLAFCLLGVATPSDLIRDTRTTPFNIGLRIELHDFTRSEASQLARGLKRNERLAETLLERIVYWTGGHPYLTQRLCQAIAEDSTVATPDGVDRKCGALFLSSRARERDDNLLFVRERMLRSEIDLAGLLTLYSQVLCGKIVVDDETNPFVGVLRLSGIARSEDGRLRVRNRIYARAFDAGWVAAAMPDAELRRQRIAYRRGVVRATAISAVVLAVIALLALAAVWQRNRAEEEARRAEQSGVQVRASAERMRVALAEAENARGIAEQRKAEAERAQANAEEQRRRAEDETRAQRRLLYAADMNLANQAWENADVARLEDLLQRHWPRRGEEDLRGFEWYFAWRLTNSSLLKLRDTGSNVAFSPDGTLLATDSATDPGIKLLDPATGRQLARVPTAQIPMHFVFSPDGKYLAIAAGDSHSTVTLWDPRALCNVAVLRGHTGEVRRVAFSRDSTLLATAGCDGAVKLWELDSFRERTSIPIGPGLCNHSGLDFSPDGKLLALSTTGAYPIVLDVTTGREVDGYAFAEQRTDGFRSYFFAAFSPDGKTLAVNGAIRSRRGEVDLWDTATKRKKATLRGPGIATSAAFSPDGTTIAIGGSNRVTFVYDLASGRLLQSLKGHGANVEALAFSPNGRFLATTGWRDVVRLWDLRASQPPEILRAHRTLVFLAYSPDGRYLATAGDGRVILWDSVTRQKIRTFTAPPRVISLAFSPDGRMLASGSAKGSVTVYEVGTGNEIKRMSAKVTWVDGIGESGGGAFAVFSPDGRRLAAGNAEGSVSLWDVASWQEIGTFRQPKRTVFRAAFSPDGRILATAGETATLWSAANREELRVLSSHGYFLNIAFSPDGRKVATAGQDKVVRLWDTATGHELLTMKGHTRTFESLIFSPDGKRLVAVGLDSRFRIWDTATGQEVFSFVASTGVMAAAFSPDGRTLATGEARGAVSFWHAATEEEVLAQARTEVSPRAGRRRR